MSDWTTPVAGLKPQPECAFMFRFSAVKSVFDLNSLGVKGVDRVDVQRITIQSVRPLSEANAALLCLTQSRSSRRDEDRGDGEDAEGGVAGASQT